MLCVADRAAGLLCTAAEAQFTHGSLARGRAGGECDITGRREHCLAHGAPIGTFFCEGTRDRQAERCAAVVIYYRAVSTDSSRRVGLLAETVTSTRKHLRIYNTDWLPQSNSRQRQE